MNINYLTENFRREIYGAINSSQLPVSTLYFVIKDVFADVANAYEAAVEREATAVQNQSKLNVEEANMSFNEEE